MFGMVMFCPGSSLSSMTCFMAESSFHIWAFLVSVNWVLLASGSLLQLLAVYVFHGE